jgi:hypothetical protein
LSESQETEVLFFSTSQFSRLALVATLLAAAKTVAHKKAIMVTSIRPVCFAGFFNRECLKVDSSFDVSGDIEPIAPNTPNRSFNYKFTDE